MTRECTKKPRKSGGPMTASDVALSYLMSFSSGDPQVIASHVTDDFENNQMGVLGMCFTGKDLYQQRLQGFLSKFRNLKYSPEKVIANDNEVAIAYRMTADDDRCSIDIHGVMIITVSGNKVSQRSDYWDGLSYLGQTGIPLS